MITIMKSIARISIAVVAILLVPLIAMQFTDDVDWGLGDFIVIGVLLFSAGLSIELVVRSVTNPVRRLAACAAIVLALLLVWAELAVGVFGTPFAGS